MKGATKYRLLFATLVLASPLRAQEVELSLTAGRSGTQQLQNMYFFWLTDTGEVDALGFPMKILPDYTFSSRVTLNSHRFVSHELFYSVLFGRLQVGDGDVIGTEPLRIREVGYNAILNFTRKNFFIRPYITAGPTLSSFRYQNLKLHQKAGLFRFALRNVGGIKSAFNQAGVAPLDGGTIFRLGLNYGGGIKFRLSRHTEFRVDYRETFSSNPDFYSPQSLSLNEFGTFTAQDPGRHRRRVAWIGIAYAF